MKLKLIAFTFMIVLTAGCWPVKPIATSGDKVFSEHGTGRIVNALEGAQAYCETRGKNAELVNMQCFSPRCNSQYVCVDK